MSIQPGSIQVGDTIPDAVLYEWTGGAIERISSRRLCAGRKVVLFAVPAAFSSACHDVHLPGFILGSDEIRGQGVDEIVGIAVNDAFVMAAWADATQATGLVRLLSDGNGDLATAMGLQVDASAFGLGIRSRRFAAVIDDGKVLYLGVEPAREIGVSSADAVLKALRG